MGDDLDDMLLAAAGRSKSKGRSDDGKKAPARASSSSDEDEDEEDEDEERKGGKGSKMPLKKRFDSGGDEPGDGYESDLSYGSDLYKNDEDKRELQKMSELEREMLLHDRYERRLNYKTRKETESRIAKEQEQLQHKQQQQQQQQQNQTRGKSGPSSAAAASSRVRSSGRDTSSKKASALNELVAKRQKAQDSDQRKRAAAAAARSPSPSSNSEGDSDDEDASSRESNRSEALPSDDEDEGSGRGSLPDNEAIKNITIRRSKLFKWFTEPFFEDVIVNCFVRIGVGVSKSGGSMYRLYLVRSVDSKDPERQYKFENRVTFKYLNCSWGDESSRWQMVRASDQPPSDEEINAWKAEVSRCGDGLSRSQVAEKVAALEKINSYVYSAAAVKQMLQEKKLAAKPASDRERLVKELSAAEGRGDQEQVERLQERIKEAEASAARQQKSKNEKAERIEMMNRRNRFENFKNASELKPVNSAAKIGEVGYDPFSRRWTRSQNYYKSEAPKAAGEQSEGALAEKASKDLGALSDPAKQDSSRLAGTHSKMFHLHDFDLPISLARLERYKGVQGGAAAAYMERKRSIEEHYGARVENHSGRRHTLTVNDYKRRRGLL